MKTRRALLAFAFVLLATLIAPPAVVWAKQVSLVGSGRDARFVAAMQLYDVWRQRLAYTDGLSSHRTIFPYLECDVHLPDQSSRLDVALTGIWIRDSDARERVAYIDHFASTLTVIQSTALTSCIEASIFANWCSARVSDGTFGSKEKIDFATGDRRAAAAYCQSVRAILHQASAT